MPNWLQKLTQTAVVPAQKTKAQSNLPAQRKPGQVPAPAQPQMPAATLPTASVIYGVAASALFVIALYFLFTGLWFTGGLILLPAACFLGFALQFLRTK